MQIINYPRAAGKTTRIVELAIERNYDILVFGNVERQRLLEVFKGLKPDQVFTINELPHRRKGKRQFNGTVIDNADIILRMLLPNDVKAVSMTDPVIVAQQTKAITPDLRDDEFEITISCSFVGCTAVTTCAYSKEVENKQGELREKLAGRIQADHMAGKHAKGVK